LKTPLEVNEKANQAFGVFQTRKHQTIRRMATKEDLAYGEIKGREASPFSFLSKAAKTSRK